MKENNTLQKITKNLTNININQFHNLLRFRFGTKKILYHPEWWILIPG